MKLRFGSIIAATIASVIAAPLLSIPASASVAAKWCWSMQSGTLRGTFTTDGTMPGDGTAAGSSYTITDMTVFQSSFPDIGIGSISNGIYAFGTQPAYQIIWSGAAVTGFWRNVGGPGGTYTNGLAVSNGSSGSGANLGFGINFQQGKTNSSYSGTTIFSSSVTPSLSPVPASGLCAEESAPQPDSPTSSLTPPLAWHKSYGRTQDQKCDAGWSPSWAQWPRNGSGGCVCDFIVAG